MNLVDMDWFGMLFFKFDQKMVVPSNYMQLTDYEITEKIIVVVRPGIDQHRDKLEINSI